MNGNITSTIINSEEQSKTFEDINKQLDEISFDQGKTKLNSDTTSLKSFSSDNSDNLTDIDYYSIHRPTIFVNIV
jgi:hypothetical protein